MNGKGYSLKFNHKKNSWLAKIKDKSGNWVQRAVPKRITAAQPIEAEQYTLRLVASILSGVPVEEPQKTEVKKTIELLSPKWLELRENDSATKPNTYRSFFSSVKNWFPAIKDVDIETGITVPVIREWIGGMTGLGYRSQLIQIRNLKAFLNDVIAEEWVSPEMANPLEKPGIKKIIKNISKAANDTHEIKVMRVDVIRQLLTGSAKIWDNRKIRYLTTWLTGMRFGEVNGLIWDDLDLVGEIPTVKVSRHLMYVGVGPYLQYEDLIKTGMKKKEIARQDRAVVSNPKYNSKRIVPLHPLVVEGLKYWKQKGWKLEVGRDPVGTDPVFPRNGISLKDGAVAGSFYRMDLSTIHQDLFRAIGEGAPSISMHSMRRGFSTALNGLGLEENKVAYLLGHKGGSVASKHYIKQTLPLLYSYIKKLPIKELYLRRQTITIA